MVRWLAVFVLALTPLLWAAPPDETQRRMLDELEKRAVTLEAAGRGSEASEIRAKIAAMRQKSGETTPAPADARNAERMARLKQLRELQAQLGKQGQPEKQKQLQEEIAKIEAELKEGAGAQPVADRSGDLTIRVTAPAGATLAGPIKPTVTIAIAEKGPMNFPLPGLGADCLTDAGNPRVSFEIWHADGKPVAKRPTSQPNATPATAPDTPAATVLKLTRGSPCVLSDLPFLRPLSELYVIDRPGRYTFQVRYEFQPSVKTMQKVAIKLISDPVSFTIDH